MPRTARKKSSSGIYHIMLRGINRQSIFEDEEDKEKYMETLSKCKEISKFELFAYCLMDNHVHLLIKEIEEGIDQIFKRIGSRYVYWYNRKYERTGHLFQDRFKSEPVEDDTYFMTVLRYILQNPIKACQVNKINEYRWSSYNEYINRNSITDTQFAFEIISPKKEEQRALFSEYINMNNNDNCLEIEEKKNRVLDEEVRKLVKNKFKIEAYEIQNLNLEKQVKILQYLKKQNSISLRQIARVTGFTVNKVFKA